MSAEKYGSHPDDDPIVACSLVAGLSRGVVLSWQEQEPSDREPGGGQLAED